MLVIMKDHFHVGSRIAEEWYSHAGPEDSDFTLGANFGGFVDVFVGGVGVCVRSLVHPPLRLSSN